MRLYSILSIPTLTLVVGCSSTKAPSTQPAQAVAPPQYIDQSAAALAFTPSVALGQPPVVLAREARQPSVFVGFDEISATSFYIRTDDRQSDEITDRHTRRAVIQKVGVTYR